MTSAAFVLRLALREARAARRKLLLLTASVTAGVGALVAINSFTDNLTVSVGEQAQALLGADLAFTGRKALSEIPEATKWLDSLQSLPGTRIAQSVNLAAMAYVPTSGNARLVQLRTVDPGWPYYGSIETSPAGAWPRLQEGSALVDPSLLPAIDAQIGDTLSIGEGRFPIVGTVVNVPGDVGLQMAFGARVFIATSRLPATKLLGFGARVEHEAFVQLGAGQDAQAIAKTARPELRPLRVRVRTVADDRDNLTNALTRLGNYLGLVALAALLLGGLGVASAVHVFIRQRLDSIAVLRCLGATSGQIFAVYLIQAIGMGLLGSALGALLGVGLQQALPFVLADFLPVSVRVLPSARAIAIGMSLGVWTAAIFSLLPLLGIREISPLATLRRSVVPVHPRWDIWRVLATLVLVASVVGLAAVQVGSLIQGAWFSAAIGAALLVLWLASLALMALARRFTPASWPYLWRQGIANLHRPANQTVTVVLALGFGAFLLTTLFTAQHNLLRDLKLDSGGESGRPNLVLFDIQPDQREAVAAALASEGLPAATFEPIVPMRITSVKGEPVTQLLAREPRDEDEVGEAASTTADSTSAIDSTAIPRNPDSTRAAEAPAAGRPGRGGGGGGAGWAYRREYRSTYRADMGPAEKVTVGKWFAEGTTAKGTSDADPVEISVEADLAAELGVHLDDRIVWDVQGVAVHSIVTSLRQVNWARFEPNFFVVFAPGALERAPHSLVTLARVTDADSRGRVQRQLAERAPNVTSVDLADVQRALESVVDRIILAIRFMALFSLATGTVVLVGAIATSRWQRVREGTLLRTLGATRGQVLRILSVEYAALGLGAAIVAAALAGGAGWALSRFVFESRFTLPLLPMLGLAAGLVALTTLVGLWNSLDVLERPPLEVLRAE
jgi:putative ABC transport system permease protein